MDVGLRKSGDVARKIAGFPKGPGSRPFLPVGLGIITSAGNTSLEDPHRGLRAGITTLIGRDATVVMPFTRVLQDIWTPRGLDVISGGLLEWSENVGNLFDDDNDDAPVTYINGPACPSAYSDEGFYCAKDSGTVGGQEVEEDNRDMLDRAYDLINDHIDYVQDYQDGYLSGSTDCMVDRLTGGTSSTGASLIRESESNHSWNATNLWGSRYMLIAANYLNGVTNSYEDETSNSDEQTCVTLALSRTIVHETAHSCWRTSEELAYIIEYYFARSVSKYYSITTEDWCCTPDPLEDGYDAADYTGTSDVKAAGDHWVGPVESSSGTWFLNDPC